MSIKDDLIKLRKRVRNNQKNKKLTQIEKVEKSDVPTLSNEAISEKEIKIYCDEPAKSKKIILLDDKVNEFINWYSENMVNGNHKYCQAIKMRNFIEKMAVWYELRYPDYEVNRLISGIGQEQIKINDVMFKNNQYLNDLLDEDSDIKDLDWDKFYNAHSFIQSLPWEEKVFLKKEKYTNLRYNDDISISLTPNGIIKNIYGFNLLLWFNPDENQNEMFIGKHILDALPIMKERYGNIAAIQELENTITRIENKKIQKEEMLNCVMYRIIERGGNRIGPRRAFLFAKEFGRNIDIPMIYGIDCSDPGLELFVNEYIKAGGSTDLVCYDGYFSIANKYKNYATITVQELIKSQTTFYTPEEDELHQRNALANHINQDELKNQEVQQLRLQRKIEKSKRNILSQPK